MVRAAHLLGGCGAGGEFIREAGSSICSVSDSRELTDALIPALYWSCEGDTDAAYEFLLQRKGDGPFIFRTKSPFFCRRSTSQPRAAPLAPVPSNLPADESLLCAPTPMIPTSTTYSWNNLPHKQKTFYLPAALVSPVILAAASSWSLSDSVLNAVLMNWPQGAFAAL